MDMTPPVVELAPAPLLHYEIVLSDVDMFVTMNGRWSPSEFDRYSVDPNGCFILHMPGDVNEVATLPMPEELRDFMRMVDKTWFVKIENGQVTDMNELRRVDYAVH